MKLFGKITLPFPGAGCQQTRDSDSPNVYIGLGFTCHYRGLWKLFWSAELSSSISKSPDLLPWVIGGSNTYIFKSYGRRKRRRRRGRRRNKECCSCFCFCHCWGNHLFIQPTFTNVCSAQVGASWGWGAGSKRNWHVVPELQGLAEWCRKDKVNT